MVDLISPTDTKHHLKVGGQIRQNGAATNVMGLRVVYW